MSAPPPVPHLASVGSPQPQTDPVVLTPELALHLPAPGFFANPATDHEIKTHLNALGKLSLPRHLLQIHAYGVAIVETSFRLIGPMLYFVGAAIFIFGVGESLRVIFVLRASEDLVKGRAIYLMIMGGMFHTLGKDMLLGRGVHNTLTSILAWLSVGALRG